MYPDESQHVEYAEVYRATKSADVLRIEDFLPSNIEHANQKKTFKNQFNKSYYGVSIFTDFGSLKKVVARFPALDNVIKTYSKGFTTITRGISLKEDINHHVDYFLYDYEGNSPKDDFKIVEVREKHER